MIVGMSGQKSKLLEAQEKLKKYFVVVRNISM